MDAAAGFPVSIKAVFHGGCFAFIRPDPRMDIRIIVVFQQLFVPETDLIIFSVDRRRRIQFRDDFERFLKRLLIDAETARRQPHKDLAESDSAFLPQFGKPVDIIENTAVDTVINDTAAFCEFSFDDE